MKIHAIQTGTVAIKTRLVQAVGHGARRQLNMLLDRQWVDPLPIYAFAIEHPEGVIVVDTGESARARSRATSRAGIPTTASGCACGSRPSRRSGPSSRGWGSPGRRALGRDDPPAHRPRGRPAPFPRHRDPRLARRPRGRLGTARAPARLPQRPLARLVRADRRRPRARRLRAVSAEPAAHAGRRRHHRAPPRPYRGPDGRHRRGRRPCRPARRRQLLHRGPDAARQARRPVDRRGRRPADPRAHPRPRRPDPTVYLVAHDPETAARLAERRVVGAASA